MKTDSLAISRLENTVSSADIGSRIVASGQLHNDFVIVAASRLYCTATRKNPEAAATELSWTRGEGVSNAFKANVT